MWIYFLLVLAGFTEGQHHFISKGNSSSSNVTQLCELATPPITFARTGQKVNLTGTITDSFTGNLWVGYVRTSSTFLYKGCAATSSMVGSSETDVIEADPGRCYSFCKTKYIGIKRRDQGSFNESKCYCLGSLPTALHLTHCNIQCTFPQGTVCGNGNAQHNVMSVYEKVNNTPTNESPFENDLEGRCLAYEPSGYLFWSSCTQQYRWLCKNASSRLQHGSLSGINWLKSMSKCLELWFNPVSPFMNLSGLESGGQFWTGAIRSFSIFNISDVQGKEERNQQGYIDTSENLMFGNQTSQLRALCNDKSTPSSSSSSIPYSTQASSPDDPRTTTLPANPSSPVSSSVTHQTDASSSHESRASSSTGTSAVTQSDNSNTGLIALYAVVPLLTIAIAVAIGLIIWRRRKMVPEKVAKQQEYNGNVPHCSSNIPKPVTVVYNDLVAQPDSDIRHDYLILEPIDTYAAIKDTEMDKDEYDTAKSTIKYTGIDTGNIYNRLEDVSDDTYNHTNTLKCREDDTYDHTRNAGAETTYNTTATLSHSKTATSVTDRAYSETNNCDDNYNHVEGARLNNDANASTEDTYNKVGIKVGGSKPVANEYLYTELPLMKPIPSPNKPNQQYDYAYATTGVVSGSANPIMFKLEQLPNAGGYDFTKESPR